MIKHTPVMVKEVLEYLNPEKGGIYVDATIGGGGHSEKILAIFGNKGSLIGIDCDEDALNNISGSIKNDPRVKLVCRNFSKLESTVKELGCGKIDGIIFDLGVSSYHLEFAPRGFSFQADGFLDMRMDKSQQLTAGQLVNELPEIELKKIVREYGEERFAGRIARAIVESRKSEQIKTTGELAEIVKKAVPRKAWPRKINVATRTFQALRIAVNKELENLKSGLEDSLKVLKPGGRIVVISYHSLEDRIVKLFFRKHALTHPPGLEILTKKPIVPDLTEIINNPRSRSAKLRAARKKQEG